MKRGVGILVTGPTGNVAIVGLISIALAVVASLFIHLTNATTDLMTNTVAGELGASKTTAMNITSNSNAVLDSLFSIGEDKLTSFNLINKTYTRVSYIGNRTIIPPGSATTTTINATERGNLTFNLQPNGISLVEGKSLLVSKGSNNGSKQENATASLLTLME